MTVKPQFIITDLGEKLVVLTHREYLALCARAGDEEAEDAMTEIIAAERQRDLDEGRDVVLPAWFCDAAARGDGSVLRGCRSQSRPGSRRASTARSSVAARSRRPKSSTGFRRLWTSIRRGCAGWSAAG